MMMLNATQSSFLSYFYTFCTLYVLLKIGLQVWSLFSQYVVPRLKKPHDYTKYGRWAVVTGCTDGIGKGFAKELASKGVDVCLVSRNEEKLKNTAKEIEESYNVRTKYIVADFTDTTVYTHIRESLADTDIGILVNSAGIFGYSIESFIDHDEQTIKDFHNVNMLSITMMTSIVLPCMKRKKRGLIINMSSYGSEFKTPLFSLYCGCKAFITMFGTCLSYEAKKDNIHVVTLIPGFIHTRLLDRFPSVQFLFRFLPFFVLSVPNFIKEALLTISSGCYKTCGYFGFDCLLAIIKLIPPALGSSMVVAVNKMYSEKN